MNGITVLYDGDCRMCRWTARRLGGLRSDVPLQWTPRQSEEALTHFPGLATPDGPPPDLVAVDEAGRAYRAERAWAVILRALPRYRLLGRLIALRLVRPVAGCAVRFVARNRFRLSKFLPRDEVDRCGAACGCGGGAMKGAR